MRQSTLVSFLLVPILALAQNLTQSKDLVAFLSPTSESAASANVIHGQTLTLPSFNLTLLTNSSHALISLNVSRPVGTIGWLAMGFGGKMNDGALIILWPNDDGSEWVLSHRGAKGYVQPRAISTSQGTLNNETAAFALVPELSSTLEVRSNASHATRHYTTVAFLRPLELPLNQTLFSHAGFVNVSRDATAQMVLWAFSSDRPPSMQYNEDISMHDAGAFGWEQMDISTSFGTEDVEDGDQGWTKYDVVVLAHAGIAAIIFLLISPAAVLVSRLGRAWGKWFAVHSMMQGYIVVPGAAVVAALGMLASYLGYSTAFTAHKFIGFLILLLVLFQLGAGYWSHKVHDPAATSRPAVAVAHVLVGVSTLVLSWVQIWLGFGEYQGRKRPGWTGVVYGLLVLLFLAPYVTSLAILARARRREGRSWRFAFLAPVPTTIVPEKGAEMPWVGKVMDRWVGDEDARPLPGPGPGERGDLSAWK